MEKQVIYKAAAIASFIMCILACLVSSSGTDAAAHTANTYLVIGVVLAVAADILKAIKEKE